MITNIAEASLPLQQAKLLGFRHIASFTSSVTPRQALDAVHNKQGDFAAALCPSLDATDNKMNA
jgi:hypothetical protein